MAMGLRRVAQTNRNTVARLNRVAAAANSGSGEGPSNRLTRCAYNTKPSPAIVAKPIPIAAEMNRITRAI